MRILGRHGRQLAYQPAAGRAPAGVDDPAHRVASLEAEGEPAEAVGVEVHPQPLEVPHPCRRLADQDLRGRAADEAAPRPLGVGQVQLEAVVARERRRQPSLRPVAGGPRQRGGGHEHDPGSLPRRTQRCVEAGRPRTDDGHLGLQGPGPGPAHRPKRIRRSQRAGDAAPDAGAPLPAAPEVVVPPVPPAPELPVLVPVPALPVDPVWVVVPGVVAPGVVVPGVVAPGVVVPGVVAPGVVVPGVVVPGVVVPAALGAVITVVAAGGAGPGPRASFTSAAARTPSSSAATTIATASGAFQLGVADRRVWAAAPQYRHQSWSVCSGEPHSGHASEGAAPVGPTEPTGETEGSAPAGVAEAAAGCPGQLTAGLPAGARSPWLRRHPVRRGQAAWVRKRRPPGCRSRAWPRGCGRRG